MVGEHGVESKGFEEVVVSSLRETASRNPPVTSEFAIERGLVDPEPALSDGDPVEAGVIDIIVRCSCQTIGSTTICSGLTSSLPTTNSTRESATSKADTWTRPRWTCGACATKSTANC